jgi:hypothetical protein
MRKMMSEGTSASDSSMSLCDSECAMESAARKVQIADCMSWTWSRLSYIHTERIRTHFVSGSCAVDQAGTQAVDKREGFDHRVRVVLELRRKRNR